MASAWGNSWGSAWGNSWGATGDVVEEVNRSGGWLSEEQLRREKAHERKKRKRVEALEHSLDEAYEEVQHPGRKAAMQRALEIERDDEEFIIMLAHMAEELLDA